MALVAALQNDGWLLGPDHPGLAKLPFDQNAHYSPAKQHGYFALAVGKSRSFTAPLAELLDHYANLDLMTVWPVESLKASGLRYPLEPLPIGGPAYAADCHYEVQFHFGHDYIYQTSEAFEPFEPSPTCVCGYNLECDPDSDEDPFYSPRLLVACPECGSAFDPAQLVATGQDSWTGDDLHIRGGATYRFAVVIDCGKCFGAAQPRFHPELKALVERILCIECYEVAGGY